MLQVLKTESYQELSPVQCLKCGGTVVSIAAFKAGTTAGFDSRPMQFCVTGSEEQSLIMSPGLVTNSLALCNCFYLADKPGE